MDDILMINENIDFVEPETGPVESVPVPSETIDTVSDEKGDIENGNVQNQSDVVVPVSDVIDDSNSIESVSVNNSPLPISTISGNNINNYNIYTVSDNSVSWNIINKPLNEYTVSESISTLIFLELLVGGIIYLIRKGIPQWH